jgi:hypothetical protein
VEAAGLRGKEGGEEFPSPLFYKRHFERMLEAPPPSPPRPYAPLAMPLSAQSWSARAQFSSDWRGGGRTRRWRLRRRSWGASRTRAARRAWWWCRRRASRPRASCRPSWRRAVRRGARPSLSSRETGAPKTLLPPRRHRAVRTKPNHEARLRLHAVVDLICANRCHRRAQVGAPQRGRVVRIDEQPPGYVRPRCPARSVSFSSTRPCASAARRAHTSKHQGQCEGRPARGAARGRLLPRRVVAGCRRAARGRRVDALGREELEVGGRWPWLVFRARELGMDRDDAQREGAAEVRPAAGPYIVPRRARIPEPQGRGPPPRLAGPARTLPACARRAA